MTVVVFVCVHVGLQPSLLPREGGNCRCNDKLYIEAGVVGSVTAFVIPGGGVDEDGHGDNDADDDDDDDTGGKTNSPQN